MEKMFEVFKVGEAKEEEENESKKWLHLCYLFEPNPNENTRKEEVTYQYNISNGIPRKIRKA